ncbi:MAG: ankyrin repeat domain-containing protein [Bacteroidetes bacterium]|nr:ankyrin repeat domain-containing protein [Bacteroidota bacterium]
MKQITLILLFAFTNYNTSGQDIFKAIETKNYVELENQLKAGTATEIYNDKGLTPVWIAVFKNDTTSLRLLMKYKANINFLEKKGIHPIMIGCLANSIESVKILLDNGVDVNWKSSATKNQQPIRFASQGGSVKLIKLLLARGADMESTPDDKVTPLLAAIHAMKYDIVKFYFESGANVNVIGRDGECVIHEAIKTKNPMMVKLALEYKAPVDIKDPNGKTTLKLAKESENSEIKSMIKEAVETK